VVSEGDTDKEALADTIAKESKIVEDRGLLAPGTILEERYEIIEKIGAGAMGTVYRARQLNVGRDVAIKAISPDAIRNPITVQRFETEARVIAELRHPNTVKLHDVVRGPRGELYLVVELLTGEPLDAVIARGPLVERAVLELLAQVSDSLAEAHAKGIVHRDLKPANIFIQRIEGVEVARVLDFGIARLQHQSTATASGALIGTPAYMSPEQASGEKVDARTDLYSLGIIAYEALAGERPFTAKSIPGLLLQHVERVPVPLVERSPPVSVRRDLDRLVMRLLAKDPNDRPKDAGALREILRSFEASSSVDRTVPISVEAPSLPRRRRSRVAAFISVAAALAISIGIAVFVTRDWGAGARAGGTLRVGFDYSLGRLSLYQPVRSAGQEAVLVAVPKIARRDPNGDTQPALLEGWEAKAEGRELVVRLLPSLEFHPHPCLGGKGRPAEGADLAYSLGLAARGGFLRIPIEGLEAFRRGESEAISGLTTQGPLAVSMKLEHAVPFPFESLIEVHLVPRELEGCEDSKDLRQPVGVGAFRFEGPPAGGSLRLVRFAGYREKDRDTAPPELDAIELHPIEDAITAMSQLVQGSLHVLSLGHPIGLLVDARAPKPELAPQYAGRGVNVVPQHESSDRRRVALYVSAADGPWSDSKIWRAMAWAIDRSRFVEAYPTWVLPTGRFLEPRDLGFDLAIRSFTYDLGEARRLLAEAGYSDPTRLPELTITCFETRRKAGEVLVANFAELGVRARLVILTHEGVRAAIEAGSVGAFFGEARDPVTGQEPYEFAVGLPEEMRHTHRSDPEIERLSRELARELRRSQRSELYARVERRLFEIVPFVPLAYAPHERPHRFLFVRDDVFGLSDPTTGRLAGAPEWLWPRVRLVR
jgi:serine/threonine protein kinase